MKAKTAHNPNNIPLYTLIDHINKDLNKSNQVNHGRIPGTASTEFMYYITMQNRGYVQHGIWFNQDEDGRLGFSVYTYGKKRDLVITAESDVSVLGFELAMVGLA